MRNFTVRPSRYDIDPSARIRELIGRDQVPETAELSYSFQEGYERLYYRESPEHGTLHFEGSYHPDGMCEGHGVCIYCGRTLA